MFESRAAARHRPRVIRVRIACKLLAAAWLAMGAASNGITAPMNASAGKTPVPSATTAVPAASAYAELLLEVHLNDQDEQESALFLRTSSGELLAGADDLRKWRVLLPKRRPLSYEGADFYPLSAITGSSYRIDTATQTIFITVPPTGLEGTVIGGFYTANGKPTPSPLGGFLNYNLFASRPSGGATTTNAYTELGLFNAWGVGTTSYLGNDLDGPARQWIRLETTLTQDHPEDRASIKIGDAITDGGMTGLATRFGGVQYATNFATQPGLVTLPLPSIGGSAAVPSTVQLYVNGVLQRTQEVPPGPFQVPTVPVASGPGLITMVITDILGRRQVITAPFYATNSLLAKGLDDFSFSLGRERQNFGVESNDYGPTVGSMMFRRGFTDSLTGEVRAEAAPGQQTVGAGGFFAVANSGIFNLAAAASHSPLGNGTLGQIGYQAIGRTLNGSINLQFASPRFTQLGYLPGTTAPRRQATGSFGAFMGDAGSVSLNYVHTSDPVLGDVRLAIANYTKSFGQAGFLSLNVVHDLSGASGNYMYLSLTVPLSTQSSASFGVSHQGGSTTPFAQVQQSLPSGTGFGYLLASQFGNNAASQGSLDYQNDVGTYDVSAYRVGGQTLYTADVGGGVGFLGGDLFASRQITDSFAVVDVPGQPDVDIYAQNQVVAHTDSKGYAVIPRLNAYQDNHIGYDPRNLSLDTDIGDATMDVVPYYRSGVLVTFPVKSVKGVTFTVKLPDGSFLPAGAEITAPGQGEPFPVGYDGEAYVTGLSGEVRLKADWADQACEFTVTIPGDSKDPLPDLGIFTCEATKP
ncbi:MAG: fimbria/pilus outer membrane usher protein [Bacillota bacterium]